MDSFALPPLNKGHKINPGNGALTQSLRGGFSRHRIQFVNNVHVIQASVAAITPAEQEYFWSFWRLHASKGVEKFLWQLRVDELTKTDYECQFNPESLTLSERIGTSYHASFEIECRNPSANHQFDRTIVDAWALGNPYVWGKLLERLVNKELPEALGDNNAVNQ